MKLCHGGGCDRGCPVTVDGVVGCRGPRVVDGQVGPVQDGSGVRGILNSHKLFKISSLSALRTLETLDTGAKGVLVFGKTLGLILVEEPRTAPITPTALEANCVDDYEDGEKA